MTSAALRDHDGHELLRLDSRLPAVWFPPSARAGRNIEFSVQATLPLYRRTLEAAWTAHTAHPAYREHFAAKDPTGQCGVSSAWLVRQLSADHDVAGIYCYGSLALGEPVDVAIARHCWVELLLDATTYVIDLTADQAPGFNEPIVFGAKDSLLENRHMRYDARIRKTEQELKDDDVWPRLVALNGALADVQSGTAHA